VDEVLSLSLFGDEHLKGFTSLFLLRAAAPAPAADPAAPPRKRARKGAEPANASYQANLFSALPKLLAAPAGAAVLPPLLSGYFSAASSPPPTPLSLFSFFSSLLSPLLPPTPATTPTISSLLSLLLSHDAYSPSDDTKSGSFLSTLTSLHAGLLASPSPATLPCLRSLLSLNHHVCHESLGEVLGLLERRLGEGGEGEACGDLLAHIADT
jgi:hypothetical protein